MAASFSFKPLQHAQFQLSSHSNYSTPLHTFNFAIPFDSPFEKTKSKLRVDTRGASKTSSSTGVVDTVPGPDFLSGSSSIDGRSKSSAPKSLQTSHAVSAEPAIERRVILKDRHAKKVGLNSKIRKESGRKKVNGGVDVKLKETRTKQEKEEPAWTTLRVGLDMCSKIGDVVGAIKIYDLARKEGIAIGQYHYAVLLYLCSSAATGTVQPAKSGTLGRSLRTPGGDAAVGSELSTEFGETQKRDYNGTNKSYETLDGLIESMKQKAYYVNRKDKGCGIQVSEDLKRFALEKGFELYVQMLAEEVPMNEATFTSVARMAMALGDGEMAFNMVKQMREYGVSPRLRSYSPALAIFCDNRDVERAFEVEQHMEEHGINPEEPELEAILKVSVEAGKGEKVYYVLHKLRKNVRQVSPNTAGLIEKWFGSKVASRVGKRKWDHEMITRAMEKGGGGWHGKGWLGKGKWTVNRSFVGPDGSCRCCGEKLVMIDLDPEETENFAKSVASIAAQRERNSSFQKFQKWLDYYGPFEAVVDAANVGLYSQRKFKPSKVNAVVNGIRQMLPSRKWPLIVLHNRRITGEKMDEPFNRALIEKWKNGDALYATPTGSNDDWYWLYAAITCRSLIVTNDEMRDHLFQLLGNDFFPRWKERHQVRFTFTETGPTFHMPPQCSVVIQESAQGHWHIPIVSESENEDERVWLCCRRVNSSLTRQDSSGVENESELPIKKKRETQIGIDYDKHSREQEDEELSNLKSFVLPSLLENSTSVAAQLEAAEKLGACIIDFQI